MTIVSEVKVISPGSNCFGLTNAPATFMSAMNDVLRPFIRKCVVVFLDDILVFSHSWEEHLADLDSVLTALAREEFYCKRSKCQFASLSVSFLGHVVTGHTIAPDPEKIRAVASWRVPASTTEVRRFLGFANFFRRFVKGYASIARPLEELTGKYSRFSWGQQHQAAFVKLRNALLSAPVLKLANIEKPFRVMTDASDIAISGVLLQCDDQEQWHPVAYTSRRLRPEERNYTALERETLAAIHALRVWKLYLFKPFELITDNQGVTYLKSKPGLSKREARWAEFLADFAVTIKHCSGKDNVADALSRCSSVELSPVEVSAEQDRDFQSQLERGYENDKKMLAIINRLKNGSGFSKGLPFHWNSAMKRLYLDNGTSWRLCIPCGPLRQRLLGLGHDSLDSGHLGRDKTYQRLARSYYWPGMGKSVDKYVRTCDNCQRSKGDKPRQQLLQPLPVPEEPWKDISIDFITGLPVSADGHDCIMTFVDRLTKQAHFVPTKSTITSEGSADLYFKNVFRLHGLSKTIVSDRDPRFTSSLYQSIFRRLGVTLCFSTPNHPQSDGQTERTHRTIEQILRAAVNHRQNNWEDILPACEFAFNNMVQESTGETAFYLNSGRHPLSVLDVAFWQGDSLPTLDSHDWLNQQQNALKIARDNIQAALERQSRYANQHRTNRRFKRGENVMVHKDFMSTAASRDQPCPKLKPRWFGPFRILEVLSNSTVRLELPSCCRVHPVFNVAALKPYHEDSSRVVALPPPPVIDNDGHERYIVESVLSHRCRDGRKQYLVKWQGYRDPTWEPERYLWNEAGQPIVPLQRYLDSIQNGGE